jgi:DNA-binding beta-propeller fold protein YncE
MESKMKRTITILLVCFILVGVSSALPQTQEVSWRAVPLPSGKILHDPPAGKFLSDLNAFPINSAVSPNGRYIAFLNNGFGSPSSGFRKSIAIYDRVNRQLSDTQEPGTGLEFNGPLNISTLYYGIAFSSNGSRLYASIASTKKDPKLGDRTQNGIRIYRVGDRGLAPDGAIQITPAQIPFPKGLKQNNPSPTPSGLSVMPDPQNPGEDLIYAALTLSDAAVELSTKTRTVKRVFNLHLNPRHPALPAEYPYATALCPQERTLYVSLYNGSSVAAVDLSSGEGSLIQVGRQQEFASAPSSHPGHMVCSPSGNEVYVAVENGDLVSVIDNNPASPSYRQIIASLDMRLPEMQQLNIGGVAPNHLSFTPDGKILLVALGNLNAVAVVQVNREGNTLQHEIRGYLPTLWYPHATAVSTDGTMLYLTSGKGKGTGSNKPHVPFPPGLLPGPYGPTLLKGSLHEITLENALAGLRSYTAAVKRNAQLDPDSLGDAKSTLEFNPFKHVIYVIKENRTYDQVFGDLRQGNGDETCLYFGEEFTPNHHRLAREFGIYDNFFDSAEVSFNGHTWSTTGINSGWNEQQWQINYSTGNFTYDSEGRNNNILPVQHNQADVDTPEGGYIWDGARAAGKTIKMYGEYCSNPSKPLQTVKKGGRFPSYMVSPLIGDTSPYPWPVPIFALLDEAGKVTGGTTPTKLAFKDAYQPLYPDFEQLFPDVLRFEIWKRDFDGIARRQRDTGEDAFPVFSIVRLGNDHTRGVRPGGPTPDASVADNDLALGLLVQEISSNEYYWGNTAIVVLEDDSQTGCDHVDSHRSIALFISKYNVGNTDSPRTDSRFLTTASAVRTIEAVLGLPPANLMTATAPLLFTSLERDASRWHGPYRADQSNLQNRRIFEEGANRIRENDVLRKLAKLTGTLELEEADQADADTLNYILHEWVRAQGRLKCCAKQ